MQADCTTKLYNTTDFAFLHKQMMNYFAVAQKQWADRPSEQESDNTATKFPTTLQHSHTTTQEPHNTLGHRNVVADDNLGDGATF